MKAQVIKYIGSWVDVLNIARQTVGKQPITKEPSSQWKKKILLAEHSPIRLLQVEAILEIPYYVSVHLVRHKIGIEHYVTSSREDYTGIKRDDRKQTDHVTHRIVANFQAIITISRKRRCTNASRETRQAWNMLLREIKKDQPELYATCVAECYYRGYCPEIKKCSIYDEKNRDSFNKKLENYRNACIV